METAHPGSRMVMLINGFESSADIKMEAASLLSLMMVSDFLFVNGRVNVLFNICQYYDTASDKNLLFLLNNVESDKNVDLIASEYANFYTNKKKIQSKKYKSPVEINLLWQMENFNKNVRKRLRDYIKSELSALGIENLLLFKKEDGLVINDFFATNVNRKSEEEADIFSDIAKVFSVVSESFYIPGPVHKSFNSINLLQENMNVEKSPVFVYSPLLTHPPLYPLDYEELCMLRKVVLKKMRYINYAYDYFLTQTSGLIFSNTCFEQIKRWLQTEITPLTESLQSTVDQNICIQKILNEIDVDARIQTNIGITSHTNLLKILSGMRIFSNYDADYINKFIGFHRNPEACCLFLFHSIINESKFN